MSRFAFACRQRSEQKRTFSQSRTHFLRQVKGSPHPAQIFCGSSDFLRILGMPTLPFPTGKLVLTNARTSRPGKENPLTCRAACRNPSSA